MIKCAKCKEEFKSSAIVNGKRISLHKRKHCLKCVPYGKRTIYKGREVDPKTRFKERVFVCITCGKTKKNKNRNNECSSCRNKKLRLSRKNKAIQDKGGKCKICSYDKYVGGLDFHHTVEKERDLSSLWLNSPKTIEKELKKCVLLCCRCHREVHAGITIL